MRVGSDIIGLQAQHALERTSKAFARALQRLASGKRINSAGDDAAGLAISTGLDSQVRAMRQGVRNINEAYGMLATTDGVLATQVDIIHRMRELSIQSANGTLSSDSRKYLNSEFQALLAEFQRNVEVNDYNGINLLRGDEFEIQVGAQKGETIRSPQLNVEASNIFLHEEWDASVTKRASVNTDTARRKAVVGDFDEDGDNDVITAEYQPTGIEIYLNDGTGALQLSSTIAPGTANDPDLDKGDINGDGHLDLILTNRNTNHIITRLGNGDGTFKAAKADTVALWPQDTVVGDLNNDGKDDFLSTSPEVNTDLVVVRMSNGDGTFSNAASISVDSPGRLHLSDLDNDGNLDLIVKTRDAGAVVQIFRGAGDGTFTETQSFAAFVSTTEYDDVDTADLNGDSIEDLVYRGPSATLLRFGNGDGTFQAAQTIRTSTFSSHRIGDMDDDGDLDLVVGSNTNGVISILTNDGEGVFTPTTTYTDSDLYDLSDLADMNGDGHLDIIADFDNESAVFLSNWSITSAVPEMNIETQTKAADMLEILDGALDHILAARAEIGALQNRLSSAENVSLVTSENLSSARSQILDTDYAEETAELMKQQILQQAGVSVLAQTNSQMQIVLSLLGKL